MPSCVIRSRTSAMNSMASSSSSPRCGAERVERRLQKVGVVDAGNLDRVLERHEHARPRARFRIHREQVLPVEEDLAARSPGIRDGRPARARACSCRSRSVP